MQLLTIITTILSPITPSSLTNPHSSSLHVSHPHQGHRNSILSAAIAASQALLSTTQQSTYTLTALNSGAPSTLHNHTIVANGQHFWVGKNTTAYCPLGDDSACPPGKETFFAGGDDYLGLGVMVPGGQRGMLCGSHPKKYDPLEMRSAEYGC